jgi:hypothetical protein
MVKDKRWVTSILNKAQPRVKAIVDAEAMDLCSIMQMEPMEFYASVYGNVGEVFKEMQETAPTKAERKAANTDADFEMKQKKRNFTAKIVVASVVAIQKLTALAGIPTYSAMNGGLVHKLIMHTTNANCFIAAIPRILKLCALYKEVEIKLTDNISRAAGSGTARQDAFGRIMCFILIQEFLHHIPKTYKDWFKADDMYGPLWDEIMDYKIEEENANETGTLFSTSFSTSYRDYIILIFNHVKTVANIFAKSAEVEALQKACAEGAFSGVDLLACVALELESEVKSLSKKLLATASPGPSDEALSRAATPTPDMMLEMVADKGLYLLLQGVKTMQKKATAGSSAAGKKRKQEEISEIEGNETESDEETVDDSDLEAGLDLVCA